MSINIDKIKPYNFANDKHNKELIVLNYYRKISTYEQPKISSIPKKIKRVTKKQPINYKTVEKTDDYIIIQPKITKLTKLSNYQPIDKMQIVNMD